MDRRAEWSPEDLAAHFSELDFPGDTTPGLWVLTAHGARWPQDVTPPSVQRAIVTCSAYRLLMSSCCPAPFPARAFWGLGMAWHPMSYISMAPCHLLPWVFILPGQVHLLQAVMCTHRADKRNCHVPYSTNPTACLPAIRLLSPPLNLAPSQAYPKAALSPSLISWKLTTGLE